MKSVLLQLRKINNPGRELLERIKDAVDGKNQTTISYINAHTLNMIYSNEEVRGLFEKIDIVHPDGIGVYLASRLWWGRKSYKNRFTGTDFYAKIEEKIQKKEWCVFFFGDTLKTLNLIRVKYADGVNTEYQEGFNYDSEALIEKINSFKPDILLVGIGSPRQEKWILQNKERLHDCVIMAVGDGIKVFAGNKRRGPKFLRSLGFEWLVRLLANPSVYWRRYIIGIPVFLVRVFIIKFKYFVYEK